MTTKTLKDLFEVYKPKSPDEQKFVDKHVTIKHKDRNGNDDDVFKGNTKYIKRKEERKGYDVGEDEKVYEEVTHRVHGYYDAKTSRGYDTRPVSIKVKADNEEHAKKVASETLSANHKNYKPSKVVSLGEETEDLEELNREMGGTISRYINRTKDDPKREAGRNLALKKRWGDKNYGTEEPKVKAVDRFKEEIELEEGMMKLSKVHIVHHHDHPAAKEFAKHYTAGMKGDHRETGPNEADEKASNAFHQRYSGVRTREGFAGSGTHVYTDHKTGAKWKVDRHPNGKTFYGTDHIISHVTGNIHEDFDLEEGEVLDTIAEDRVLRSLVAYYEELGEEVLIDDILNISEELIDELSRKTLASYVKKASKSAGSNLAGAVAGSVSGGNSDDIKKMSRNYAKRQRGTDQAADRLAKEEVEHIDELSKGAVEKYANKAFDQSNSILKSRNLDLPKSVKKSAEDAKERRRKGIVSAGKRLGSDEMKKISKSSADRIVYNKEEVELDEKLTSKTPMGTYIKDFQKSDAPQFKGKSQEKRREMAIAAKLANEEIEELDEMKNVPVHKLKAIVARGESDEKGMSPAFGMQIKAARNELARRKKAGIKEEVEELDELSKKTLGSYSYKAATDLGQRGITIGAKVVDNKATKDDFKKMGNRQKGVAMAVKKLTKEDVINITLEKLAPVLEDVEPLTPEERLVSKLDGISESHIHLLLSLFESLNEDNQTKMLSTVETEEGIRGLIDFAIDNRGE